MLNPKTTLSGYASLLGTLLVTVAATIPPGNTSTIVNTLGLILLGGGAAVGNVSSKDGSH